MPNFLLSKAHTDDVIAYILSLKQVVIFNLRSCPDYCRKKHKENTLNAKIYLATYVACALLTGSAAARPFNQHSGSECYVHSHQMYVPDGLNYPRQAWASWGITCPKPKEERQEATTADSSERPAEWCGWWMRQHLGGQFGPEYNLARNWLNVGRPLPGPAPGAIGVKEHHVFQVVRVVGPNQVLAISGNDHNAVLTRIRSTAGVIGWRDVSDLSGARSSDAAKQKTEGAANDSNAANVSDGLAW